MGTFASLSAGLALLMVGCVGDTPIIPVSEAGLVDQANPTDGGGGDAAPDVVGPVGVTGVVLDSMGIPIAGADVRIGTNDAKTDSTGKFTLAAPATYDVLLSTATSGTTETITPTSGKKLTAFLGISTRTPTLRVNAAVARTTSLTLTPSGVTLPLTGADTLIFSTAPTTTSSTTVVFWSAGAQPAKWSGSDPSTGNIFGYHVTPSAQGPTAWKAQTGPIAYSFTSGGNPSLNVPFIVPPSAGAFQIAIDASGQTINRAVLGYSPAAGAVIPFLLFGFSGTSINAQMPTQGTSSVVITGVTATSGGASVWRNGVTIPASINVKLPVGDVLMTAPAAAATGVASGATFSWGALAGYGYHVRVNCGSSSASYLADFVTMAPSFTLPDTSTLGIPVPAAKSCTWSVEAFEPVADANALVGPIGWLKLSDTTTGNGTKFGTALRQFTTQ